jgi:hypothetical protein
MASFVATRRILASTAFVGAWLWAAPVRADTITVDWDVVPHEDGELEPTPYYDCRGDSFGGRRCEYLWEEGIELHGVNSRIYEDKFFDGEGGSFNFESALSTFAYGDVEIRPRCEAQLAPCFDEFSPLQLDLGGLFHHIPPALFITSSRGGLRKFPSVDGVIAIDFHGSQWEKLEWLQIGFYLPAACEEDPAECSVLFANGFVVDSLTFRPVPEDLPVPEPTLIGLLGVGVVGLVRRATRRRTSQTRG